jgi:hypothetical protein
MARAEISTVFNARPPVDLLRKPKSLFQAYVNIICSITIEELKYITFLV